MEGMAEKVCPYCGEKLPDDSLFCVKCGKRIVDDITFDTKQITKSHNNLIKKIVISIVAVILIVFIVNLVQVSNLKKELERDWCKVEGKEDSYILCILDFNDNEVEYRLETGYAWLDTTVATYEYKVISRNKIKVLRYGDEWETIKVEFNNEKTVMQVSPALTSIDDTETWVNLD